MIKKRDTWLNNSFALTLSWNPELIRGICPCPYDGYSAEIIFIFYLHSTNDIGMRGCYLLVVHPASMLMICEATKMVLPKRLGQQWSISLKIAIIWAQVATAQIISHRKGLWMHKLYSTRVEAPNTIDDCHNNDFVSLNPQGRLGDDKR